MQPTDPNYWNPVDEPEVSVSPSSDTAQDSLEQSDLDFIAWEASETLQHNNGKGWYAAFFAVAAVLIGFAIIFRFWFFIPVVVLMAVAAILHVRQPPRIVRYRLDDRGLQIDDTVHPYTTYKSFGVIQDGAFLAILLIPTRRIALSTIVYFDEADGEAIVDAFGARLPMEHHDLDPFDRFLRLIRF